MYKFMAAKADEIMTAMGAAQIATVKELSPYEIHTYQSTHPTGGAIMGSDPEHSEPTNMVTSGIRQMSS